MAEEKTPDHKKMLHFEVNPKGSKPTQKKITGPKGERTLKIKRAQRAKPPEFSIKLGQALAA